MANRIAELSPAKLELLSRRLKRDGNDEAIPPRANAEPVGPLSFFQEQLWFLDQLEPGSPAYNIPATIRLTGDLNAAAFEQSLVEIMRRHEILRASFPAVKGQAMQAIAVDAAIRAASIDLRGVPEGEREARARRLAMQEAHRPFDLAQGPLMRVTLVRLGPRRHAVLFVMHHIISDEWSISVLTEELSALYAAFSGGMRSPLEELHLQYADFTAWQRQRLSGEVIDAELTHWKRQLSGAPDVLKLPTDYPRPTAQSDRGAAHSFALPAVLSESLRDLSKEEGVTLFITMLAAFKSLLHYYTRQDDLVVGSPVANRNRREIEGLIGYFVNTLVLRTDLSGNPSFRQLLRRVTDVCTAAYAHQDLPFEKLVKALRPERSLGRTPLFHVSFTLQNAPKERFELGGLALSPLGFENATTPFDLIMRIIDKRQGISGLAQYRTDLFAATTIRRFLRQFETLLYGIVARPDATLDEFRETLSEADRRRQIADGQGLKQAALEGLSTIRRKLVRA